MKAAFLTGFGDNEVVKFGDLPEPIRSDDAVLVEVHAAGVNPVEVVIRQGLFAALPANFPIIMGFDMSGIVLEALGGPRESVRATTAAAFDLRDVDALNTVAIEVAAAPGARVIARAAGLADALFEHDGQITKREIRAVTLSALAPRRGEFLWDIGAGARLGGDRMDAGRSLAACRRHRGARRP